jgi:hypothetical protein
LTAWGATFCKVGHRRIYREASSGKFPDFPPWQGDCDGTSIRHPVGINSNLAVGMLIFIFLFPFFI